MARQRPKSPFPWWGSLALPGCVLWGVAIGAGLGFVFGNVWIGAAIGAGLGAGVGLCLFAAAIVVASSRV